MYSMKAPKITIELGKEFDEIEIDVRYDDARDLGFYIPLLIRIVNSNAELFIRSFPNNIKLITTIPNK